MPLDTRVRAWMARDPDPETRAELKALIGAGDDDALSERFETRLAFGTAGLRGVLGAGSNRMNRLVVRETTAGLGNYLLSQNQQAATWGVVIGFDGRRGSRVFAEDAAAVLAALGIPAHLFEREVPTPILAFAVAHLKAAAGIMVTASHNPPEYNGYKVYWQNGAQIIPPHDAGIAAAIEAAALGAVPWQNPGRARHQGRIKAVGDAVIEAYLQGVRSLSLHGVTTSRKALTLAYTPLHGVGAPLAEAALAQAGFKRVHTVASQREPDGSFPTVNFPNPEEPGTMDAVLDLAREHKADLACANDPDADRLAIAARTSDGDYRMLTGNELGVLLGWDRMQRAPKKALVATTIVSSRLLGVMAKAHSVGYFETLTGFKWLANVGLEHEARGRRLIFGYEEALGYMVGGLVHDKDGISALVAFAELAAACADQGGTVLDKLEEIYRTYGLHLTAQRNLPLSAGTARVGEALRRQPTSHIADRSVVARTDLLAGTRTNADGQTTALGLPKSDVLIFELRNDARVIVRPSGTEPKLKCYYEVREPVAPDEPFAQAQQRGQKALEELIDKHQASLSAIATP